jgi:hypothetical protein
MRTLLLLSLILSLGGPTARAAGKPSSHPSQDVAANRQAQEKAAKKACATGEYKKGIDILADLYVDTNDPNYVFNQGRCYEQNSRFEQAIERFREFLRKATTLSDEDRKGVDKHIADCEGFLPKPAVAPVAPPPTTQPEAQPVQPLTVAPEQAIASSAERSTSSGAGLRVAGIVTASVGAAALVAGVVLNLKHESLVNEQNTHFSRSRESDVSTYMTWSLVGYGVGAAAVLAGGTLWFLGRRSSSSTEQTVALLPVVDAHAAGCVLQGGF